MRIGRPPFYASTRDETQMKVSLIGKAVGILKQERLANANGSARQRPLVNRNTIPAVG